MGAPQWSRRLLLGPHSWCRSSSINHKPFSLLHSGSPLCPCMPLSLFYNTFWPRSSESVSLTFCRLGPAHTDKKRSLYARTLWGSTVYTVAYPHTVRIGQPARSSIPESLFVCSPWLERRPQRTLNTAASCPTRGASFHTRATIWQGASTTSAARPSLAQSTMKSHCAGSRPAGFLSLSSTGLNCQPVLSGGIWSTLVCPSTRRTGGQSHFDPWSGQSLGWEWPFTTKCTCWKIPVVARKLQPRCCCAGGVRRAK